MMIAIDQNRVDSPPPGNELLVVPDICLYENIKGTDWQTSFNKSFSSYRAQSQRLHIAHAIGSLLRQELASGKPIATIVDWEWSKWLQQEIGNTHLSSNFIQRVDQLKARPLEPEVNLADNRRDLESGLCAFKRLAGDQLCNALRESANSQNKIQLSDVAPALRQLTLRTLPYTLEGLGITNPGQSPLLAASSVFFRNLLCFWMHIFQFARDSGNIALGDKRLLNDLVDSDYAVIGTFCDGLITGDSRMRERYEGIKAALQI
jgi:hypothetical protein